MPWPALLLIVSAGLACAWWTYVNLAPHLRRGLQYVLPPAEDLPPVAEASVVVFVPGRDEAEHLPTTLPELCEQDHQRLTVVFIDDQSGDATPRITSELSERYGGRLVVVRNEADPPQGWAGKPWAVKVGVEAWGEGAAGELPDASPPLATQRRLPGWFCFTDADVHWGPDLLQRALGLAAEHDADLVGLLPRLRFGSVWEAVVQLQLGLALGILYPVERSMDPRRPDALIGGAFLLVRRELYENVGGHDAVKGEVVEDITLARTLKAAGARVRVAFAQDDSFWCRMYDSWADQWEGLTKHAYAGVGYRWYLALPMLLAVLVCNILGPFWAGAGLAWLIFQPGVLSLTAAVLGLGAWLGGVRPLNAVRKKFDLPWWTAWSMPVGSAIYVGITLDAIQKHYRGGVTWKGRRYGASGV